jgi:hypothetical protein
VGEEGRKLINGVIELMNKKLTFLLELTFLFLFSGSVFGQEEVKKEYWDNGKLKGDIHWKDGEKEGLKTLWFESGEKKHGDTLWIRMKT